MVFDSIKHGRPPCTYIKSTVNGVNVNSQQNQSSQIIQRIIIEKHIGEENISNGASVATLIHMYISKRLLKVIEHRAAV